MNSSKRNPFLPARLCGLGCVIVVLTGQSLLAGEMAQRDTNIPPYRLNETVRLGRPVGLQDNKLLVAFDSHSGVLTWLDDKTTHWIIERRPNLGVSFPLFAPLPHRNYNPVFGQVINDLRGNAKFVHDP